MLKLIKVKGSENWYVRGTYKKQEVFQTTGTSDRVLAQADLDNIVQDINERVFFRKEEVPTFGDAATAYREAGGSARYLGEEDEDGNFDSVLGQFIDTPLDQIGQKELDAAARRAYPGVKPQTLNRQFYTPFIAVWNHHAGEHPRFKRTWKRPTVKQADKTRKKWFRTPQDAAAFFEACSPHSRILFMFYLYTGARTTEGLELDLADLFLDEKWAVLSATKTDEMRGVPLHPVLVKCLRWYIGDRKTGRVLLKDDGRPYKVNRQMDGTAQGGGQFKSAWRGAKQRSGIHGVTPYSLRHTLNNWLIRAGTSDAVRDAIMGHARDTTNSIYSDVPQADQIAEISKLPDFTDFLQRLTLNHALFTQNKESLGFIQRFGKDAKARKQKEKSGAVEAD